MLPVVLFRLYSHFQASDLSSLCFADTSTEPTQSHMSQMVSQGQKQFSYEQTFVELAGLASAGNLQELIKIAERADLSVSRETSLISFEHYFDVKNRQFKTAILCVCW